MIRAALQPVPLDIRGPALLCDAFRAMLSVSVRPKRPNDAAFVTLLLNETCADWGAEVEPDQYARCVYVSRGDLSELLAATRLGIQVFVGFEDDTEVLSEAVRCASREEAFCSPTLLPRLLKVLREGPTAVAAPSEPCAAATTLSVREREIAALVAAGGSNEQVAERLFVSVATVKFHLGNVYRKLGISRRGQLFGAIPGLVAQPDRKSPWSPTVAPIPLRVAEIYGTDALSRGDETGRPYSDQKLSFHF